MRFQTQRCGIYVFIRAPDRNSYKYCMGWHSDSTSILLFLLFIKISGSCEPASYESTRVCAPTCSTILSSSLGVEKFIDKITYWCYCRLVVISSFYRFGQGWPRACAIKFPKNLVWFILSFYFSSFETDWTTKLKSNTSTCEFWFSWPNMYATPLLLSSFL